jgi:hypothetical protein
MADGADDDDDEDVCIICLSEVEHEVDMKHIDITITHAGSRGLRRTSCDCKYTAHEDCIRAWHTCRPVCPVCRNATSVAAGGEGEAPEEEEGGRNVHNHDPFGRFGRRVGGSIVATTFFTWLVWFMAVPSVDQSYGGQTHDAAHVH